MRKTAESNVAKYTDLDTWNKKGDLAEGDTLEGYYVDKEVFDTKFGSMVVYIVERLDGTKVKIAGQSDIKRKFDVIPAGSHVWITFDGLTETKNGAMKSYTVEFDDEDIKEQ